MLCTLGLCELQAAVAMTTDVTPGTVWNAATRASMPAWVQVWIYFMFVVFGSGLAFVRKHS